MSDPATILMVCTANICRSPLAAFSAQRALGDDVTVLSAGVDATPGSRMCDLAAQHVAAAAGGEAWSVAHRSRQLTAASVELAGLVLTMTVDQQDAVGRLVPEARSRTFTILEAARILDSLVLSELQGAHALDVTILHTNRWRAAIDRGEGRRWWRGRRTGRAGLSLPDWHQGQTRSHEQVLRTMLSALDGVISARRRDP